MSDAGLLAVDAAARQRALDTAGSFIVRAPAGSGKTELLIQRVLALLATVEAPEEVVAITFTRKAAAEMRQRVVAALQAADREAPIEAHLRLTWSLAGAVRRRDLERGWCIVDNPNRLRVQTIDALAQWLARQLPLALGLGAAPEVTEDAAELYRAAARATIALVDAVDAVDAGDAAIARSVARLLSHLDNDVERGIELLATMLGRRDQWLRHLHGHDRAPLEAALQRACERQMQRVCERLPAALWDELVALARYAAGNGGAGGAMSPCADLGAVPEAALARLDAWHAVASMLLTDGGEWRGRFTVAQGFPPGETAAGRAQSAAYKARAAALVEALSADDDLRAALHGLRALPPPRYTDAQWEVVEAIVAVLPRAAAELAVVFAEAGRMDFAEVTRRAVVALGDERASDVALALDARMRHVLIDEFQDTSITQFELIERLVSEWSAGDGRTLFVVGDPMQSIYRFREAEVGLFLRAWERGVGPVTLERLRLTRNFRSGQGIVDWVNRAFAQVLPAVSDIATGAVSFEPAVAVHPAGDGPAVMLHALAGSDDADEADEVVRIVREIRAADARASIALLVRARPHLVDIATALRRADLRPTAVELHALAARPLVSDLLALTRALDHGGDRTAWLAVLRAPWCALTLADLAALAEGDPRTVPDLLADASRVARLSADGRARLGRVAPVLARAVALAECMPPADRVEDTWLLLGGPACLGSRTERADARRFFEHLVEHEQALGGRIDPLRLQRSLQALFAAPDVDADPAFHVMTIHKAKGLEFDHVIVPRLGAAPRGDDPALMRWLERPADVGTELLVAPIRARGGDRDALLDWVEAQSKYRQQREDERLAYVAATRARACLHWVAAARRNADGRWAVPPASLLARLWPVFGAAFERAESAAAPATPATPPAPPDQSLRRLPADWRLPTLPAGPSWSAGELPGEAPVAIEFSWAGETARRVGVVVHRWLQRMAEDGLAGWDAGRLQAIAAHVERALAAGGLSGDELAEARRRALQALTNVLNDERGRWVLGAHPEHRSELRLSAVSGGRVRRLVLDRTFVAADGARWIVDYKVGAHEGGDVEAFLDAERVRYAAQIEAYGSALDPAARLGLYFPLVPGWRSWVPAPPPAGAVGEPSHGADIIPVGGPPRTEVP